MDMLRQERERQGLSLKEFGALSGVERTTIGKAEKGRSACGWPMPWACGSVIC
jgi:transcriptional regulator with XRE-family HTH domain